jgi:hypothetical protein
VKKEVADKWADALESGNFKQTSGALRRGGSDEGFCCLGVLCELAIEDGVKIPVTYDDELQKYLYNDNFGYPPAEVVSWAGLYRFDGSFKNETGHLDQMNDAGVSFADIAKAIRENWENL